MTLMMLVNLGFAGGGTPGPTFLPAWARGSNVIVIAGR